MHETILNRVPKLLPSTGFLRGFSRSLKPSALLDAVLGSMVVEVYLEISRLEGPCRRPATALNQLRIDLDRFSRARLRAQFHITIPIGYGLGLRCMLEVGLVPVCLPAESLVLIVLSQRVKT